jgi:hypothetical protein
MDKNTTSTSVMTIENNVNLPINDFFSVPNAELVAENAKKVKQVMAATAQVLSTNDVVDFGGNPLIMHGGCKKIANLLGLVIRANEDACGNIAYQKMMIDEAANHYVISVSGKIWHRNNPDNYEIYEGSCDSFNIFFAQGQQKDENRQIVSAKLVKEMDVRKKALANFMRRAIEKFTGIKFTWEDLQQFGFNREAVASFSFNNAKADETSETKDLRATVWQQIMELSGMDTNKAGKILAENTAFNDFNGHQNINKVSEKQLNFLAPKIEALYKKSGLTQKAEVIEVEAESAELETLSQMIDDIEQTKDATHALMKINRLNDEVAKSALKKALNARTKALGMTYNKETECFEMI